MGTSSFEKAVCLQFNALMMILIKGTLSIVIGKSLILSPPFPPL